MILFRHRVANLFLLFVCRLHCYIHVRWLPRAGAAVARFIHGPLDPERLYTKTHCKEISLSRLHPIKRVQPDVSALPGAHPEDSDLEKWLSEEARCAQ